MILGRTTDRIAAPASRALSPEFTPAQQARLQELRRAVRRGERNDYGAGWTQILFLRWLYRRHPSLRG